MKRRTENNLEMLFLTSYISTFAGGRGEGDELLGVTLANTLNAS